MRPFSRRRRTVCLILCGCALLLLGASTAAAAPVTLSATANATDGQVTLDASAQHAGSITVEGVPTDWSVADVTESGAFVSPANQGDQVADQGKALWAWQSDRDEVTVSVTFDAPADAAATMTVIAEAGSTGDKVSSAVTVGDGDAPGSGDDGGQTGGSDGSDGADDGNGDDGNGDDGEPSEAGDDGDSGGPAAIESSIQGIVDASDRGAYASRNGLRYENGDVRVVLVLQEGADTPAVASVSEVSRDGDRVLADVAVDAIPSLAELSAVTSIQAPNQPYSADDGTTNDSSDATDGGAPNGSTNDSTNTSTDGDGAPQPLPLATAILAVTGAGLAAARRGRGG
jgi:hypothetical protein